MTFSDIDKSQIAYARLAGLMYILDNLAYAVGLNITSRFQVPGNYVETARRIAGAELYYRFGLSFLLIGGVCTVFLAMGLYGAVKPINKNLALFALGFRLAEAALFGVVSILSFASLQLYIGVDYGRAFDAGQLSVLANLFSVAGSTGFNVASIFFSPGSIIFFYLFFKARSIPRVLSAFTLLASVVMLGVCFAALLLPQHARTLQLGWIPLGIAEFAVGFWLLFKGIKQPRCLQPPTRL